ncbi:PREDICTED: uncharacterized protein LOC106321317 [Brassica oleracea var. oleracea]|uniref:uncharacterized protein LOC106321317 n=1 Tax=Brassica oleracea var. oleracea TaxID=109376 RepID=UPI0006A6C361|nr:PREDICTED: uncharacterized protein LOC106321317 [Brassica oleracea var. oleracea]
MYHKRDSHDTKECKVLIGQFFDEITNGTIQMPTSPTTPKNTKSWSKSKEKKAQKSQKNTAPSEERASPERTPINNVGPANDSSEDEHPRRRQRVEVILSRPYDSSDDDVPTVQPNLRDILDSKDKQSLAPSTTDKDLRTLLKRKSATNENTGTADLRATISKCNARRVGQTGDLCDQLNSKADDLRIQLNRLKGSDLRRRLESKKKQAAETPTFENTTDDLRKQLESMRATRAPHISVIMGVSPPCGDSVRAVKDYKRQATTSQKWPSPVENDHQITFSALDTKGVHMPYNDPLLVDLDIGECLVAKVLIDTGSSVDLIFRDTLDKMGVDLRDMKPSSRTLTGFNGASEQMIRTIRLPVYAGGITRTVKFSVIRAKAPYNAILGTPWLHSMKAVPSTYHQCVKFLGKDGKTQTIHGDQQAAGELLIATVKMQQQDSLVNSVSKPLNKIYPRRRKFAKSQLMNPTRRKSSELASTCPTTYVQGLSLSSKTTPRQRSKAVNEEVNRLLDAGFITEVRYPEWLANPVVVKKRNGKWRIFVDFTDLNRACPKDSYPLPHIDRLVESTAGNELLTFMDAFSGYNQILMHPDDREKTEFITDRGTYCYKLGNTMEVYIDDMLVKSLKADDHLDNLRDCFKILNDYGMKLNPAKGNKRFVWDEKCEEAFNQVKHYLTTPPVLSKPEAGDTLSLYIAVTSSAVSSVLIREDRGEQKPIFYTSKRMTEPETRYPTLEKMALAVFTSARKLRPYFQSHTIEVLSNQPLRTVMQNTNQPERLTKWAMELREHDIVYKNRTAAKSQGRGHECNCNHQQENSSGSHSVLVLRRQTTKLSTNPSRLAKAVKAKRISAYCDSQLVVSQYHGDYDVRNERMDAYLKLVQDLTRDFEFFELTKVPRGENVCADALAALGSKLHDQVKRTIPIHKIEKPSIDTKEKQTAIAAAISEAMDIDEAEPPSQDDQPTDWRKEIIDYLAEGLLSTEKWDALRLKRRSAHYVVMDGELHRWTAMKVLLKCISGEEKRLVMAETHEGAEGNHSGGRP